MTIFDCDLVYLIVDFDSSIVDFDYAIVDFDYAIVDFDSSNVDFDSLIVDVNLDSLLVGFGASTGIFNCRF